MAVSKDPRDGTATLEKRPFHPSAGGGIDIAARLRFLIAHKWDRTVRRPLRWVGATIVIPCVPIVERTTSSAMEIYPKRNRELDRVTNKKKMMEPRRIFICQYPAMGSLSIPELTLELCPAIGYFYLFFFIFAFLPVKAATSGDRSLCHPQFSKSCEGRQKIKGRRKNISRGQTRGYHQEPANFFPERSEMIYSRRVAGCWNSRNVIYLYGGQ